MTRAPKKRPASITKKPVAKAAKVDRAVPNTLIPKTKGQAEFIRTIAENELTICKAPAGVGKTFISVGMACQYLMDGESGVKRIVITRPLVQCGPGMGYLPGDLEAKASPFMRPLFDALNYFLTPDKAKYYLANNTIEIVPLEIMRGDNLHNSFVILDEMQNCSYKQLEMFATRLGENSKTVISGDLRQSDLDKYNFSNSETIQTRFIDKLVGSEGIGYCELGFEDIVRSGLAKTIIIKLFS